MGIVTRARHHATCMPGGPRTIANPCACLAIVPWEPSQSPHPEILPNAPLLIIYLTCHPKYPTPLVPVLCGYLRGGLPIHPQAH